MNTNLILDKFHGQILKMLHGEMDYCPAFGGLLFIARNGAILFAQDASSCDLDAMETAEGTVQVMAGGRS
jgi:hypothetical protein